MAPSLTDLNEQLMEILDSSAVLPAGQLGQYAIDGLAPLAAVRPNNRQDIARVMQWAAPRGISVFPHGGGTQLDLGNKPDRVDLALDLRGCNRVLDFQPADLTVTVEAGITLEALQQELAQGDKLVPLEAPLPDRATVGGILASGASGPLRFAYGLAREWLIGIGVVGANGVETKAGGKVVKNVTGYDLNKLYTGSLGSLGVIVEASFKLTPLPATRGVLVAGFPSFGAGVEGGRALLSQVFAPQGLHVVDGPTAREKLGIVPAVTDKGAVCVAFFFGRARSVQRRLDDSRRLLQEKGADKVDSLDEPSGLSLSRRLTDLGWEPDNAPYLGMKINVPPSSIGAVAAKAREEPALGSPPGLVVDAGFGTLRLLWWRDSANSETDESRVIEAIERLGKLAAGANGSAVVEHCPLAVKERLDVWGESSEGIEIMRRIKQKFDPSGILNPGRFVGRI